MTQRRKVRSGSFFFGVTSHYVVLLMQLDLITSRDMCQAPCGANSAKQCSSVRPWGKTIDRLSRRTCSAQLLAILFTGFCPWLAPRQRNCYCTLT